MASDVIIFCGHQNLISTKPAGAYAIANILRKYGMTVMVINFTLLFHRRDKLKELINRFVSTETKFICLSNTIISDPNNWDKRKYVEEMSSILDYCKSRSPNSVSIHGGSDITQSKGIVNLKFDYAVEGQGETSVLAIINHVIKNDRLVVSEVVNGTKYVSEKVYGYGTFNSELNYQFNEHDCVSPGEALPIEIGRGCVFRCSFCNFPLNGKRFDEFNKSQDVVYETMMSNYEKFGVTRYTFIDDTINDSLQKAIQLENVVNRLPFTPQFGGFMRLEIFQKHPEMIEIYKNCGLIGATFGIETFNREAGLTVGKGFGEKAKDVLITLKEKWGDDIATMGCFIIGLPYDTREDIQRQFEWLENNDVLTCYRTTSLEVREGDFILKDEKLKQYYTFNKLANGVVYDWESPIMTRKEANSMRDYYMGRSFSDIRNTMFKRLDGFRLPVVLKYYSMEELKTMSASKYGEFERNVLSKQMEDFHRAAMKTTMSTTDSSTWTIPQIKPNNDVFVVKIRRSDE